METILSILRLIYVVVFFIAIFISLKFEWGKEAKDERGQSISSKSYRVIFPLLPIGWLAIELFNDFVNPLDYSTYKLAIWFLLTGTFIVQAVAITMLRRKY